MFQSLSQRPGAHPWRFSAPWSSAAPPPPHAARRPAAWRNWPRPWTPSGAAARQRSRGPSATPGPWCRKNHGEKWGTLGKCGENVGNMGNLVKLWEPHNGYLSLNINNISQHSRGLGSFLEPLRQLWWMLYSHLSMGEIVYRAQISQVYDVYALVKKWR